MIAAIREAARLDGRLRRIRRERRLVRAREAGREDIWRAGHLPRAALRIGGLLVLPLVPEALALLGRRGVIGLDSWILALSWFTLIPVCALAWDCGAVRLTRFEALRVPDRTALRLSRWIRRAPWCLWASLCLGIAIFHLRALDGRDPWGGGTPLLVAAVPLGIAAASGIDSLLRERLRRRLPCVLSVLAAATLAWTAAIVALLGLGAMPSPAAPALIVIALFVPRSIPRLRRSTWAEPAVPDRSPAPSFDTDPLCVTGEAPAAPSPLPRVHPGRTGMRGAAAVRREAHWRIGPGWRAPRDLLKVLLALMGVAAGPGLAVLAMALAGRVRDVPFSAPLPLSVPLVLAALAGLAPKSFGLPPGPRLWLFGADLREQVIENLRALLLRAAVPTLVAGWVAMALLEPTPERWLVFAAHGAVFLFRAGILERWAGTVMAGGMPHEWIPVTALAAAAFAPRGVVLAIYVAAAGAGLLGLLHLLLVAREPLLREHLRAGRWSDRSVHPVRRG